MAGAGGAAGVVVAAACDLARLVAKPEDFDFGLGRAFPVFFVTARADALRDADFFFAAGFFLAIAGRLATVFFDFAFFVVRAFVVVFFCFFFAMGAPRPAAAMH